MTVSVIGAPMHLGQPLDGTDEGPDMIRSVGLLAELRGLHHRIDECGDLAFDLRWADGKETEPPAARNRDLSLIGRACEQIAATVAEKQRQGNFSLVLGGDHSIGTGTVAGMLRAHPGAGVLWVDAHADINTPETSESGNVHGMPIGIMLEDDVEHARLPGFEWLAPGPLLAPSRLVYVGLRDLDTYEVHKLRAKNIRAFSIAHIDRFGIGKVMEMALDHLGDAPLMMSFDIDAVDPTIAPATGTKVKGGLTYREAHFVCEAVAERGNLVHMDMVEVNPRLGKNGEAARDTAEVAVKLIASALGNSIL